MCIMSYSPKSSRETMHPVFHVQAASLYYTNAALLLVIL
jgi:hypothetical protein